MMDKRQELIEENKEAFAKHVFKGWMSNDLKMNEEESKEYLDEPRVIWLDMYKRIKNGDIVFP